MEKRLLGKSGLEVSRLAFGSLTVGPLQANLSVEEGARVIAYAFDRGINFIDTAQYYQNYEYIGRALQMARNKDIVLSTKSYAYSRSQAIEAVEEARRKTGKDVIDVFMLHETESELTIRGHLDAVEYYGELFSDYQLFPKSAFTVFLIIVLVILSLISLFIITFLLAKLGNTSP